MTFNWLRQMRRRLTGKSHGQKRAACLKRRSPAPSEALEERKVMTANPVMVEITEAALAKAPDLPATPTGAPILAVDTTLIAQLQVAKDQDFVRLPVQANQLYRIDLSVTGIVGAKVEIKSADGKTTLATGVVPSNGLLSLEWKALKSETVSLKVFSTNNTAKGGYRLTATRIVDDVPDTAGKGRVLKPNESFDGRLDHTKDQDWFLLAVKKGDVLVLKFESHNLAGAKLTLFDAAGTKALKSLTSAVGSPSEIEWTSDRNGNIALQVLSSTKSLGRYTVATNLIVDDHSGVAAQATSLKLDEPIEGSLQFNQDIDWFRFRADAGKAYVLNWSSDAGEPSEISLYRGTSAKPIGTESLQDDGPGQIVFNATESGDYVVKINRPGTGAVSAGFRDVAAQVNYTVGVTAHNSPPRVVNPLDDLIVDEDATDEVIDLSEVFADSDPDDELTLSVEGNSNPSVVSAELEDNGKLRLTFAPNQHGPVTITLRATDESGDFVETTLEIEVGSVNDAPEVINTLEDVNVLEDDEDESINVRQVFGDVDVGDVLTLELVGNSDPQVVTATLVNGELRLSFAPNQSGDVKLTLRATDLAGASVETELNVSVEEVNDAPTVGQRPEVPDYQEDDEPTVIDVSSVFVDVDRDDQLSLLLTDNSNTELVTAELIDGKIHLSFAANRHGTATLTLQATDSLDETVETTLNVVVESVNDEPIAIQPIEDIVVEQDSDDMSIDLSEYFEDVDEDDVLTFTVLDNSNSDVVTATVEGTILRLSFASGRSGPVSITLLASDLDGTGVQASFNVDVVVANTPPVVFRELTPLTVDEDSDDHVEDISDVFADSDPDDELTLSVGGNSNPDLVTVTLEDGQLRLSFAPNQHGTATLTLVATDLLGASVETTWEITVDPVNDAPEVLQPLDDLLVDEDAKPTVVDLTGVFGDPDVDDLMFLSLVGNTNSKLVTAYVEDGQVLLSFAPNGNGDATLTLRGTDAEGLWVDTTLTVSVTAVNDAPVVVEPIKDVIVDEDADDFLIDVDQVFGDVDKIWEGDELLVEVTEDGHTSLVSATVEGSWLRLQFVPNANGNAVLTLSATDLAGESITTSFKLIVKPVNDAPEAGELPESFQIKEPGVIVIDLSKVFSDVDQDTLSLTLEDEFGAQPDHAWIADGHLFIRIDGNNPGPQELTIVATDPAGASAKLGFSWTVLETISESLLVNGTLELDPVDGDLAEFSQPTHGKLERSADDPNVLIYTPSAGFSGSDTAYYRVVDSDGEWSVGVIQIQVVDASAPIVNEPVVDGDTAVITWGASKGLPTEYRLDVYEQVEGEWVLNELLSQTVSAEEALEAELTDLSPDTKYRVIVTAVYSDLEQEFASDPQDFETLPLPAPTGLNPINIGIHEITVGWDATEDERVTAYVVDLYDAANNSLIGSRKVGSDELEVSFTGLRANYVYRFTLKAEYGEDTLIKGETIEVRTEQVYQAPEVIIGEVRYQKATVTWTDPGWGPKGYAVDLEKYDAATDSWKPLVNQHRWRFANESRTVEFTDLNSGSRYRVIVTAKDSTRGLERASVPVEFTTLTYEAPIVTVDGVSYHQANATWTAPGWNVQGYSIDVEQRVGGNWVKIDRLHDFEFATAPRQQQFGTLPAGAHLRIVVTAKNNDQGIDATGISREFDTPALTPPTNVAVSNVGFTNATVSWNKVAWPVDHYRVDYSVGGSNAWTSGGTQLGSQSSQLTVNGLKPGTLYVFRVVAVGSVLNDQVSSPPSISVKTQQLAAPIVTVTDVGRSNATITWTDPGWGPKGYSIDLEKFDKATNSWKPDTAKHQWKYATENRSWTFTGLVSETQYRVTVTAKDNDRGIEQASAPAPFTTTAFPGPTNVRMAEINRSSATVAWNKVEGWQPERYRIEVKTPAGLLIHKGTTAGTNASYEITGLTANTAYTVQVTAVNDSPVLEKASSILPFSTKAFTPPTGLSYTSTKTSVTLTWNAVDWNVTDYFVQRLKADGTWERATPDSGKTTATITGLTSLKDYTFRVVAKNGNATTFSDPITTRTK